MTRRPFDPNELDRPSADADQVIPDLERYLDDTATGAPRGLEQRIMAAVEREPAPRRGLLAWLLTPPATAGGMRRFARGGLLAATLIIAVAGALLAGQLADLVRNVGSGSPTPTESASPPPPSESVPSPTTSPVTTPSGSPEASVDAHQTPRATGTPDESEVETPEASSSDSGEESKTPKPSPTASPAATPGS